MTVEQYSALVDLMPQIEKALESKGEKIPRPKYETTAQDAAAAVATTAGDGEQQHEEVDPESENPKLKVVDRKRRKANIEATSDEDEGE
jgi:hypothetical protein